MDSFNVFLSIGAQEILNYSIKDIIIFILAGVALVKAFEGVKKWLKERKTESYDEINDDVSLKNTVNHDHDRLGLLEKQVLAITRGVKEMLKTDLMESHDKYMARKPFPYITKYERLVHISMYDAYAALEDSDPVINGFHKELLELIVQDNDSKWDGGDI